MSKILPVRDPVYPEQHLRDYINMLADLMGWRKKRHFYNLIGIRNIHQTWVPGTDEYIKAIQTLAPCINRPFEALLADFDHEKSLAQAGAIGVGRPSLLHAHPRICPECIQESPFIRSKWTYSLNLVCRQHDRLLVDQCPQCDEVLSWEDRRRFHCECGYSFEADVPPPSNDPKFLKSLQGVIDAIPTEIWLQVMNHIARPLDCLPARVPLNQLKAKQLLLLCRLAALYITDENYRTQFSTLIKQYRQRIAPDAIHWPIKRLPDELPAAEYLSHDRSTLNPQLDIEHLISLTDAQPERWVTPKRLAHSESPISNELIGHCDTQQLAEFLQVPIHYIGKLMRSNIVTPLRDMRTTRDTLFDLAQLDLRVECAPLNQLQNALSFKEIVDHHYLELFQQTLNDLLRAANKDVIPHADRPTSLISQVSFDRKQLNQYFESRFLKSAKNLTIKEASRVLAVSPITVEQLLLEGLLSSSHKGSGQSEITKSSLRKFLRLHLSLNRECMMIDGTMTKKASNYLKGKGYQAVYRFGKDTFYKGSKKVRSEITTCLTSLSMNNNRRRSLHELHASD